MRDCLFCFKKLVKNGFSKTKKQQFYCRDCKKSFTENKSERPESERDAVLQEGLKARTLRQIAKSAGVSPSTASRWMKMANGFFDSARLAGQVREVLSVDEISGFIEQNRAEVGYGLIIVGGKAAFIDLQ